MMLCILALTSAPGLGSPHPSASGWAHYRHICTETALAPAAEQSSSYTCACWKAWTACGHHGLLAGLPCDAAVQTPCVSRLMHTCVCACMRVCVCVYVCVCVNCIVRPEHRSLLWAAGVRAACAAQARRDLRSRVRAARASAPIARRRSHRATNRAIAIAVRRPPSLLPPPPCASTSPVPACSRCSRIHGATVASVGNECRKRSRRSRDCGSRATPRSSCRWVRLPIHQSAHTAANPRSLRANANANAERRKRGAHPAPRPAGRARTAPFRPPAPAGRVRLCRLTA